MILGVNTIDGKDREANAYLLSNSQAVYTRVYRMNNTKRPKPQDT